MVAVDRVDAIIDALGAERSSLIPILQDIQEEYRYLPREALQRVAELLDIPLIDVFGVATFYRSFTLEPRGKHCLTVCLGTACHVHGAPKILEKAADKIGVGPGETSEDMRFSLETVNCLGCCALGPVMVVDGEYHGKLPPTDTEKVLEQYK